MNIDSIINGIVIDHIAAGRGMMLYKLLHLDRLDCSVAIIKNVHSNKMGKKDIIKVDAAIDLNTDVIGYVDPNATVNVIRDGKLVEKKGHRPAGEIGQRHSLQEPPVHLHHRAGAAPGLRPYRPGEGRLPLPLLRDQSRAPGLKRNQAPNGA